MFSYLETGRIIRLPDGAMIRSIELNNLKINLILDESFEYGTEGKLYCQVETYPAASIEWYQNDTLMYSNEKIQISPEHNMILIKNISQDDAGEYKCEVENEIERRTFTAVVSITGLGNGLI